MSSLTEFERRIEDETLQLHCRIWGYAPVQAEGTVAGKQLYFRARHDGWSFAVAASAGVDPVDICFPDQGFLREGEYGTSWDDAASYMEYDTAEAIIRRCAADYIQHRNDDSGGWA